jgi:hypothetical protein
MPTCRRFLFALWLASCLTTPGPARLGETLSDLTKRFDRPLSQTAKDNASWLFEAEDGALLYSVTFNAKGQSIAEGLKPVKRALFTKKTAMTFIEGQLVEFADSTTKRIVPPGEKYSFAGQGFTCGRDEYVVLDDARGLLLVWTQGTEPAVMVVSPEMLRRGK